MAGDWIKMRVWLSRDPRVISMADYLALDRSFMNWLTDPVQQSCKETAHEHVTRNVTVALCVTGLLVTWGTAREQGDREGDDLVLDHADFSTLDGMTDIPGFGEAMRNIGWVESTGCGSLRFPRFFKDNESPEDKHRRQAAERQARFRGKNAIPGNVTSNADRNVTVTPREEERREEKTTTTAIGALGLEILPSNIPYREIVALYNEHMGSLAIVRDMTKKRRDAIRSAWQASKRRQDLKFWKAYFEECADDPFLNGTGPYGKGHENWRPNFDYLLKNDVVTRVYEKAMTPGAT